MEKKTAENAISPHFLHYFALYKTTISKNATGSFLRFSALSINLWKMLYNALEGGANW